MIPDVWPQPDFVRCQVMDPWLTPIESKEVAAALNKGWIGPGGPFVTDFETHLASFLGQEAVSVSNGSVALILALAACEVSVGDDVIVPDLSYAAVASSVKHVGAIPVFADVSEQSWTLTLEAVVEARTSKTKAVIAVHSYGIPADVVRLRDYCRAENLFLIEDVAEAFTGRIGTKLLGTVGDVATFSFFANKLVTTGEGGAVSSANAEILERVKLLRGQGQDPSRRYWFLTPGFNFRMGSLQAALGTAQLSRLDEIRNVRESVEQKLEDALGRFVSRPAWIDQDFSRAPWIFSGEIRNDRISPYAIAERLARVGIETRPIFYPLSQMPAFFHQALVLRMQRESHEEEFPCHQAIWFLMM